MNHLRDEVADLDADFEASTQQIKDDYDLIYARTSRGSRRRSTSASSTRRRARRRAQGARAEVDARVAALQASFDDARASLEGELGQWRQRAEVATDRLAEQNEMALQQAKLAKINAAKADADAAERASLNAVLGSKVASLDDVLVAAASSLLGQRVLHAEEPLPPVPGDKPAKNRMMRPMPGATPPWLGGAWRDSRRPRAAGGRGEVRRAAPAILGHGGGRGAERRPTEQRDARDLRPVVVGLVRGGGGAAHRHVYRRAVVLGRGGGRGAERRSAEERDARDLRPVVFGVVPAAPPAAWT